MAFTVDDAIRTWSEQGHNPRTREAFSAGVRDRVARDDYSLYSGSAIDYRQAYLAGREEADIRLTSGQKFRCEHCGALHSEEPFPWISPGVVTHGEEE